MGMTHLQLQNAVVDITRRSDKKTSGEITSALNLAQKNAATMADFERLRTAYSTAVVDGDSSFSPPTGTTKLYSCRALLDSSDYSEVLEIETDDEVLRSFPDPTVANNGFPSVAYLEDGLIKFLPAANNSYTMEGKVQIEPVTLSADGDMPSFDNADLYLIYWASGHIFESLENPDLGGRWMGKAERELRKLVGDATRRVNSRLQLQEFRPTTRRKILRPAYLFPFRRRDD